MIALSRKTLFAIEAVLDIAHNSGGQPVRSQDITRRQKIPRRYLEQVLQQLVRANILSGIRGPRGGYVLARERRRISVGDVVRVVNEPTETDTQDGSKLGLQVLLPALSEAQDAYMAHLDGLTMQTLCLRAQQADVPAGEAPRLDYAI